jgi:hypothetical protein
MNVATRADDRAQRDPLVRALATLIPLGDPERRCREIAVTTMGSRVRRSQ